ncbi:membrane hypothetical protein [metagenome]|uniref:Integral membrane protein n=1 Tax=metagenome TaxID=256318 RepID=A0A2P2C775_9ZZZZ
MGTLASGSGRQDLGNATSDAPGSTTSATVPPPAAALELRVHGVHGTSPASMLGVKDPRQVAGDGITGVFRTGDDLPRRSLNDGHAVEAYSWGALTSAVRGALGWVQRVLWLGLLPFALVNLAYWSRLHVGTDSRTGRWGAGAVRWAALLLTMLIVLTSCFISLDLVAWQCYRGGTKSCDVLPSQLDFMMFLAPSQRLVVASAVPLAGIALMWFLSHRTLARYESCTDSRLEAPPPAVPQPEPGSLRRRLARLWAKSKDEDPDRKVEHLLQDSRFWSSTRRTTRLQHIHLAAAVATLMAYVGVQVWKLSDRPNVWTFVAAAILLTSFVAAARLHPQDLEYYGPLRDAKGPRDRWTPWLMRLSVLLVVFQLIGLAEPSAADASRRWASDVAWFGHNLWFIGTFVALSAINIAVFVAGRMHRWLAPVPILVFVGFVVYATWLSVHGDGARTQDELWVLLQRSLLVAVLFFTWMLLWQWSQARPERDRGAKAWYGAAPAVLIGASGWIALLFTTAAVTAAAEYLNGPDQSVSDLTSSSGKVEDSAAPERLTDTSTSIVVGLSEGVVLRDGIVVMGESEGDTPRLVRGAVEVGTADVVSGRLTRTLPDTVLFKGTLTMEDATLLLVDTCWVTAPAEPPPACHPETKGFVSASEVSVPAQRLRVSTDGRVRLSVDQPPNTPLVVPQVLIWAPIVQVVWVLLAALIAIACFFQLKARVYRRIKDLVDKDGVPTESRNDIRSKRLRAAYAHRAERLLELLGGVTVVCVLGLLCLSATGLPPNALVGTLFPELRSDLPHLVASMSLYVVLALSAGFVLLSSYVRRSEATRKAVGILWDLTTFWPRAAHPLSPPCYAERVVPELTTRIRWALRHHGTVVVSGHSQGSLIAAATLIRLEDELENVRFVTYGSQLRALYGRIFPRVLGPDVLGNEPTEGCRKFKDPMPDAPDQLVRRVLQPPDRDLEKYDEGHPKHGPKTLWDLLGPEGWYNFFRRADPLGWRVFSDEDSDHDLVTPEVPPPRAGDPGPTVATHSAYQHTPEYRAVVCTWLGEDVVHDADWTIGEVKPLPEP